ncbi:uncharacterized protein B0I36DRAFT_434623 [Microdochium trichocladiopsis]|uniref:Nucleoside phosphorylase domain-containing protein n=1 Tax=Microdochium trichocladiopsis TaxID=1682393 RepID=A0A9P9BLQ7_9PEZI|nr:uncharacterized protein B0I36DRAFT_434623 [Microdochium trichocladiopsis]KAH7025134.1 hypothetical protein B0I36DRAFT_434623 [Microdochium trichocladiopsis]
MAFRERPPRRPAARADFEIAIICALVHEADAVKALFDHHWDDNEGEDQDSDTNKQPYDKASGDPNAYSTGTMGRHNVVLVHMPGMGKTSASMAAAYCKTSFPNIRLALIVGVCGAVPFYGPGDARTEIVLGDVVVSSGVVQHDLGRRYPDRFERKDTLLDSLARPTLEIRSMLAKLQGLRDQQVFQAKLEHYLALLQKQPILAAQYPGKEHDRLFEPTYHHLDRDKTCIQCGCDGPLLSRNRLALENNDSSCRPRVHFGLIASGDTVLKSGEERDRIAREEGIIGFEMEGAGVWDIFPCLVIKGACDYADSHKSKAWQHYAAAIAAACAKAFLDSWVPRSAAAPAAAPALATRSACVVCLPLMRNKNFTGRTAVLEEIRTKLFDQEECRRLAIVGLGGVGKTQIALQFAHWMQQNKPEYHICWLPVSSIGAFDQAYLDFGARLGVTIDAKLEEPKETIRNYLCSESAGKWLLIVDNADDAGLVLGSSGIEDYLPESEHGLLLFTTRSWGVGCEMAGSDVIKLDEMEPHEARDLLAKSLIRKPTTNEDATDKLLQQLTFLPLAITQATAYLNRNQVSIKQYLHLLNSADQNMVELMSREFRDSTRYRHSNNAVATTWLVSFEQIQKYSKAAAGLLAFISCVEPKSIPRSMLPKASTEVETVEALSMLLGYAFLVDRGNGEVYDMHSLVHLATRLWVEKQGQSDEQVLGGIRHLGRVLPSSDANISSRREWRLYLPHAVRLLATKLTHPVRYGPELTYRVARQLIHQFRFTEALPYLQNAYEQVKDSRPPTDRCRSAIETCLARAYAFHGMHAKGISLMQDHVDFYAKFDSTNPARLAFQLILGDIHLKNGQVEKAITLLEEVVAEERLVLPEQNPSRLDSERRLAGAYLQANRFADAEELLVHVVENEKLTMDAGDKRLLEGQMDLADTYIIAAQPEKGTQILEELNKIARERLDAIDILRLQIEDKLAQAFMASGRTEQAIELLESIVDMRELQLPEEELCHDLTREWLADAYSTAGQPNEAIRCLELQLEYDRAAMRETIPRRVELKNRLAGLYLGVGRPQPAIELLENVDAEDSTVLDDLDEASFTSRFMSRHWLARAYVAGRRAEEAVHVLEDLVACKNHAYGPKQDQRTREALVWARRNVQRGK